jgi:hypothetical protein
MATHEGCEIACQARAIEQLRGGTQQRVPNIAE